MLGIPLEPPQRLRAGRHGEADQRQEARRSAPGRNHRAKRDAAAAAGRSTARAARERERPRPRGTATAAPPRRARRRAQASSSRTRHSKRLASALSSGRFRGRFLSDKRISHRLHQFSTTREVTRVIWGAMRAKARPMNARSRLRANRAAAPPPACRHSPALAASRRSGRRRPAPPAPAAGYYTVRRARRHRLRPSSRQ